jgi:biopolymer transport protein TolR
MRQRRLKNEINVVPYIDVMLVLLVIFMVATPMMTTGSVDLPSSGTAPQKPDKYVKVQIKDDGSL